MMDLSQFGARLDDILATEQFSDIDGSPNGIQVASRNRSVERVAVAVDAAMATIDAAVEADADVLVTHHGLWWEGIDRLRGRTFDRVANLIEHDIGLYVSHLPLDAHQEFGNAAGVADVLELERRHPFGHLDEQPIGQRGWTQDPIARATIVDQIARELGHTPEAIHAIAHGPDPVEHVAIVTGSGSDWLAEAIEVGADMFITGEGKHRLYHEAREAGMNVILAGHYATETFGIKRLADIVERWGLESIVIDHPTHL